MKKLLVICQNYPSPENPFSQPFIHYRLKEYLSHFSVSVLSFGSRKDYKYEEVCVFTEKSIREMLNTNCYDLVISHAPNIRNHQRFLTMNIFKFKKILFIFHGYEVIDIHKRIYNQKTHYDFPTKYSLLSKFYHRIKLPLTCLFFKFINSLINCCFVFVSESLHVEAKEDLGCHLFYKDINTFIINNPISFDFQNTCYNPTPIFDYVCVRPFSDPKYGVDIFIKLAENHPHRSFHLYGSGQLPTLKQVPTNLKIIEHFLKAEELIALLNNYHVAILPTRWDSQGVLACEIAATGMPLFTSDLSVCKEILGNFENVKFYKNEIFHSINLDNEHPGHFKEKQSLFSHANTTHKEIRLVNSLLAI
jgi:glycosyltransferase involved in cell wall biosynthesis